jgi:hypothetical protein
MVIVLPHSVAAAAAAAASLVRHPEAHLSERVVGGVVVNVGGCVYRTLMTCVAVVVSPQPLVAVHVRVRWNGFSQVGVWAESVSVNVTSLHAPVAVTVGAVGMSSLQSTVTLAGIVLNVGLLELLTLKLCSHVFRAVFMPVAKIEYLTFPVSPLL